MKRTKRGTGEHIRNTLPPKGAVSKLTVVPLSICISMLRSTIAAFQDLGIVIEAGEKIGAEEMPVLVLFFPGLDLTDVGARPPAKESEG